MKIIAKTANSDYLVELSKAEILVITALKSSEIVLGVEANLLELSLLIHNYKSNLSDISIISKKLKSIADTLDTFDEKINNVFLKKITV